MTPIRFLETTGTVGLYVIGFLFEALIATVLALIIKGLWKRLLKRGI